MARSNVLAALTHVLAQEGGYVDHPADPGGATNKGITIQTLAQWRGHAVTKDDVRNLSIEEAGEIYRARYWQAVHADDLPAGLDLAMFDYAVNSGPARAIKTLQQALGLTPDGRWTAQIRASLPKHSTEDLIQNLCARRLAFLKALSTYPVFGRGWTRRVAAVERASLCLMASGNAPLSPQPSRR